MLMTLTPSTPNLTKTTTITPLMLLPMPAQRLLYVGRTRALSKKVSLRSAKSKPCLSRLARRFGPPHAIFMVYFVFTFFPDVHSRGGPFFRGRPACFALGASPP